MEQHLLNTNIEEESFYSKSYSDNNKITLHLGDCIDFLNKMPDESIDLVVTSPPYNIGKDYEDTLPFEDYLAWQDEIIGLCIQKLKPTGNICWQVGNNIDDDTKEIIPLDIVLYDSFKKRNMRLNNRIVWHFGHGLHASKRFSGRYETILWFSKTEDYTFNLDPVRVPQKYPGKKSYKGKNSGEYTSNPLGKNPSDVWKLSKTTDFWEIPNVKSNHVEKTIHPCQYPVSLIERLILSMTNEDDLVFDPFMGVGTTQVAAILNKRRTAGCEIVEEYFNLTKERVKASLKGTVKIRPDKPVYKPAKNTPLTTNPFKKNE